MFASQLLKILETIPSDVEKQTGVYVAVQDMTMKENQNEANYDSKSFGSKETFQLDGLQRETHPIVFEVKGKDGYWNPFLDDIPMDNQNGTLDSTVKEYEGGLVYHPIILDQGADSLFKDTKYGDQLQSSDDRECSMIVEELAHLNEIEPVDSFLPHNTTSKADTNLYTDNNNNVLEPPIVCYKEINYHVVKDICVDAGDKELLISDGFAASPLDKEKIIISTENENKNEEIHDEYSQERPKLPLDSSLETNSVTSVKTVTDDASEEESLIETPLPIQEFGTRSFLRSFMNNLDTDEHNIQLPDQQISSEEAIPEIRPALSAEAGPKEDVQASSLAGKSNKDTSIEKGNEPSIKLTDDISYKDTSDECVHVQSPDSKDENSDDLSSNNQLHISGKSDNQEKYDAGETSFSAASFTNYSEPIAFSGSISLRSDGSATSARSFAFPVLQNEWNSSPVRMRKPEGKHFRKHKGWRSGLLCCKF